MIPQLTEAERWERAVKCVRLYIRDDPRLNRLLRGLPESTDQEIRMALGMAIDDWNTTPPPLGNVTIATHPVKMLLIQKTAVEVIRSAMLWHSREHMPSSDGGTSADDHAKAGEYSVWLNALEQEYERKKADYRVTANINGALTGMGAPSEYSFFYIFGEDLIW